MLNITSALIERLLAQGNHLEAMGKMSEAEQAYEVALTIAPGNVVGLFMWGSLLFRKGEFKFSAALLERALRGQPDFGEAWSRLSLALLRLDKFEDAEAAARKSTELEPENGGAWNNLGIVLKAMGRFEQAIASYKEAVRLMPGRADVWNNWGNALRASGELERAVGVFREAVGRAPDQAETWSNLGVVLGDLGRREEAVAALNVAVKRQPERGEYWENLGEQLAELGRKEEAIEACQNAVKYESPYPAAYVRLAMLLCEKGQKQEAVEVLREGMKRLPDATELGFELARMTGEEIRHVPTEMVRGLFDRYAGRFEEHLVKQLNYRGPALLMEALEAVGVDKGWMDIFDAGCGTGLCGELLRPLAKTLVGVDLSQGMVDRAKERGIYSELMCGELVAVIKERRCEFDLIVAGDVLIYLGDLEEMFAAARAALRDDGWFAFTVEKSSGPEMVLGETKRFAHSLDYVRRVAAKTGFVEKYAEEKPLRENRGKEVTAWVVVLRSV